MKMIKLILLFAAVILIAEPASSQKTRSKTKTAKPIIFAVLNDGKMIEPIAYIEKGKLTAPVDGGAENTEVKAFNDTYYRPRTAYPLIFGGAPDGAVTVKSSDASAECSSNMAQVTSTAKRAKLRGMVMALATNAGGSSRGSGVRRMPTSAERIEIESLVRAEFTNQKVPASAQKDLRYHNLTALDVDGDKDVELVGSYWVESDPKSRELLFLIAEKGANGKYSFGFSEFGRIKEENVMSGEIAPLDTGILHELLLDILDYDEDGVAEIFTYSPSFEGAGFNVYRRESGKWVRTFEGSNYHCGY